MAGVLKKQGSKIKKSLGDRIVDVIIYVGLALVALSTVLPFLYVVAGSFATDKELSGEETLDASVDAGTGGMLCDYIFLHTDDRSNPCIQAVSV